VQRVPTSRDAHDVYAPARGRVLANPIAPAPRRSFISKGGKT
jgi:hypothetical protein